MPSSTLLKALAVTAELTGTQLSPDAVKVMAADLCEFDEGHVVGALTRCRKELRGRLTLAEIILRLDDGRPGVEEAWALVPKSEAETGVLTDEIATAMGVALPLLPDQIAARMTFKEVYMAEITRARNEHKPVRWFASLGHDPSLREAPIRLAVEKGRLSAEAARPYLPSSAAQGRLLVQSAASAIVSRNPAKLAEIRRLLKAREATTKEAC